MQRFRPTTLALVCATFSVLGPSVGRAQQQRDSSLMARSPATSVIPGSFAYAQPGDVVRLRIWREPDMSGDFSIDADGVATFPRLGAMRVTRTAADSLRRLLIAEYTRYLKNPTIEIVLLRRVRVLGAVRSPGLYTADQTMRIRDVVALAGGANADGRTDQVTLHRNGRTSTVLLNSTAALDDLSLQSGDELYVPERNWFARNASLVSALASMSAGVIVALATR